MINKWVATELEGINIGDKRLNERIMHLLTAASKQPQMSINKMFHTRSEVQACYRFFSNDLVDEQKIHAPHLKKTFERAREHPVILCLSDTTSLNYTTRKKLKDSGYISSNNAQGFFLHATIAVTPERLHLGIIGQKYWAREKEKPTRLHRDYREFTEKESYRWFEAFRNSCDLAASCEDSRIVHITDREGDLFEIYSEYESRQKMGKTADFVIRSNHNRSVYRLDGTQNHLYTELEQSKILGEINFEITNREDLTKRRVHQSVQACRVELKGRYGSDRQNESVSLNAIYLKETNPPEGEKGIIWCLLTSLSIETTEEVIEIVKYYLCRWEIEIFFKTFKSGCKVEEKSLRSAERLYSLFSLLLIVAWRINFLLHIAREMPEVSCEVVFEESEWKAGYIAATRKKVPPSRPPTIREMMGYVAKLGGYLSNKNDYGIKAVWVGICKLTNYADAWDLFGPEARNKKEISVKKTYA